MIDSRHVPDVAPEETLARFILSRSHIRNSDNTIKPNAFVPPPGGELSVTRHRDATVVELWRVGGAIAAKPERILHGRGDVVAVAFLERNLTLDSDPVPGNPNHANVSGWPIDDKGRQLLLALHIAASAKLVRPSDTEELVS